MFLVLTSLKANFNIFLQMSRCSPVYVPEIETGRHVKNNACAVEIKIKWIKRKQMTYENTYRDDIAHGIIQTVFFFFYLLFISNISHDVIMFHSQYQKRALTTRYIVGERRTTFFSFLVTKLGLCIITPGNLPSSSVERPPSSD